MKKKHGSAFKYTFATLNMKLYIKNIAGGITTIFNWRTGKPFYDLRFYDFVFTLNSRVLFKTSEILTILRVKLTFLKRLGLKVMNIIVRWLIRKVLQKYFANHFNLLLFAVNLTRARKSHEFYG